MEVREAMLLVEHPDHDAEEGRDDGHAFSLQRSPPTRRPNTGLSCKGRGSATHAETSADLACSNPLLGAARQHTNALVLLPKVPVNVHRSAIHVLVLCDEFCRRQ
jgi:hypothetical protein